MKKLYAAILGLLLSTTILICFWIGHQNGKKKIQHREATLFQPQTSLKPDHAAGTNINGDEDKVNANDITQKSPDIGTVLDDTIDKKINEVNELSNRIKLATNSKDKMDQFDLLYHKKLLNWPTYSIYASQEKQKLKEENHKNGKIDINALIQQGNRLLDQFWENGHLGNPKAFDYVYRARALAELALETDPQSEEAYILTEQAILCYAICRSPYKKKSDPHFDNAFYDLNLRSSNDLRYISLQHFVKIISKKQMMNLTAYDLAVVNHALEVLEPIDLARYMTDASFVSFFDIQPNLDKTLADRLIRKKCLTWMRQVVLNRQWRNHLEFFDPYMKALDENKSDLPRFTIYQFNISLNTDQDWHTMLTYNHRYDGLIRKYNGMPAFIPSNELPQHDITDSEMKIHNTISNMFGGK